MKPIEPGCLAIVLKAGSYPENVGKVCRVIQPTNGDFYRLEDGGRIPDRTWHIDLFDGEDDWYEHESGLLRIDDYDASTEETTSDKEVTV